MKGDKWFLSLGMTKVALFAMGRSCCFFHCYYWFHIQLGCFFSFHLPPLQTELTCYHCSEWQQGKSHQHLHLHRCCYYFFPSCCVYVSSYPSRLLSFSLEKNFVVSFAPRYYKRTE